ncbi:exopolysaccharide biosynthesis-like protein [Thermoclostridium stercorarium subsp. stercorarium DSM 8532]|uniref:Exopolysaccharide biosynthesis-like protein n=1 Tax=Thermoclostridium stercorarium (strain ATCC 35414 / DSM 8532 / NCIMB 11754) TaxID=1121335 RepID=L7VKC3_THES1|nr:Wzz/FepE/Etk N-terminal domain-containing protein [Thermoclostridium stercorarium]AGC67167.1 exopolysaccharide biosynthesis-like protein [Thermoclostridium stercorarium subsp. stercorarium DSM 8532]AGI38244.1 exopolysaccharide biosynthesis protein [Thermoclostridium stercorarium subsp. stercorarium DSM 8532]
MEEISLREILEVILKGKWLIALITIVAVLLTGIGTYIMLPNSQHVVAIININYPGIEQGLNPDGTQFDILQLKSPYVIEKALEELALTNSGLKLDEIRRNIDITPIVPDDVSQRAETILKQGQEFVYYPSEYKITYKINKAFSYSQGIQLVEEIISQYKKYFYMLYSDVKTVENTISNVDLSNYDYPDIVEIINKQVESVQELLESKAEEGSGFRSSNTGYTFTDLSRSYDVLKNVDITKLESLVNTNTLTKDRERLIKDYEYRVKRMELEMAKKSSEAEEARKLMDQYKKEDYVLLPDALGGQIKTENTSSYYSTLAEMAITASVEAANLQHEIEYYRNEIERLKSVPTINKAKLMEEADNLIETIKSKMSDLVTKTNDTLEDYYLYKYENNIRQIAPAEIETGINILMNLAIAFVAGIMIGIFAVLLRYYWKSTENEKISNH